MVSEVTNLTNSIIGLASANATADTNSKSIVSMDDFLKILSATMSNPSISGDSSSGGSNTDYVSQLAQFATMDKLNEVGKNVNASVMLQQQQQAFSLMGKQVEVTDGDKNISGTVDKVRFANGYATIVVGGQEYNLSQLNEVDAGTSASASASAIDTTNGTTNNK